MNDVFFYDKKIIINNVGMLKIDIAISLHDSNNIKHIKKP